LEDKAVLAFTSKVTCWNCGKPGHDLRSCPEPRNQDCIDKAKTSFHENKKFGTSNSGGVGGGGSGYSRGKFGKPPARGETVHFIMRGVAHVVGQLHTPPSIMMIGMLAKAHLSSMTSTHRLKPSRDLGGKMSK